MKSDCGFAASVFLEMVGLENQGEEVERSRVWENMTWYPGVAPVEKMK